MKLYEIWWFSSAQTVWTYQRLNYRWQGCMRGYDHRIHGYQNTKDLLVCEMRLPLNCWMVCDGKFSNNPWMKLVAQWLGKPHQLGMPVSSWHQHYRSLKSWVKTISHSQVRGLGLGSGPQDPAISARTCSQGPRKMELLATEMCQVWRKPTQGVVRTPT